jgi:hypothetical protein
MDDKGVSMPMAKLVSALGFTGWATLTPFTYAEVAQILAALYSALLILQLIFNWVLRAIAAYRERVQEKIILLKNETIKVIEQEKENEFDFLKKPVNSGVEKRMEKSQHHR